MANRRKRTLRVFGTAFVLLVLALVYGAYRFFNPYDEVVTQIEGIPPDSTFVCLVASSENGMKAMEWSLAKVVPFSMHPDGCTVSSLFKGETTHHAKVRWIDSRKIGVLRKTAEGDWKIAWFGTPKTEPRHRSFLFGRGSVTLDVSKADNNEPMTIDQLRLLGMDYSLTHD